MVKYPNRMEILKVRAPVDCTALSLKLGASVVEKVVVKVTEIR
jgi:hypothetical protein